MFRKFHVPLLCVVAYLAVLWSVPPLMENRPAFKLKTAMRIHNVIQLLINGWLLLGVSVTYKYVGLVLFVKL